MQQWQTNQMYTGQPMAPVRDVSELVTVNGRLGAMIDSLLSAAAILEQTIERLYGGMPNSAGKDSAPTPVPNGLLQEMNAKLDTAGAQIDRINTAAKRLESAI